MVEQYVSIDTQRRELSREIGAPPRDTDPDAPAPVLARWYCLTCRGTRSDYEGLGTKQVGDKIEPVLDARPCPDCLGSGIRCPICRGARYVRKRAGYSPAITLSPLVETSHIRKCPGCHTRDGEYDAERELATIREHYREAVLEKQVEMPF